MSISQSKIHCHSCGCELDLPHGSIPRTEECPRCRADVRVCYNCKHYDAASYNECSEPMAERVVDKDRRNFCEYFSPGAAQKKAADSKAEALKKLDALFKK